MSEFDSSTSSTELMETATVDMGPPRILLAEDDYELRSLLIEALEEEGYDVVPAEDGFHLLERLGDTWLAENGFDLVLSDIRMPGCTGLEALEALREKDWSTPIVFMTAFGSAKTHHEAELLGADVVDKPFDLDELVERVRAIVPPSRYEEGWSERLESALKTLPERPDSSFLRERLRDHSCSFPQFLDPRAGRTLRRPQPGVPTGLGP